MVVGRVNVDNRTGTVAARIDDPCVAALTVMVELDHHNTNVIVEMLPHFPFNHPQVTIPDIPLPCRFLQGSLHQSWLFPAKSYESLIS